MTQFFIIVIIILILLYFLFFRENSSYSSGSTNRQQKSTPPSIISIPDIDSEDIFVDEEGEKYYLINKVRKVSRKTYIKGNVIGKYHGDINPILEEQFHESKFFDFNIYEIIVDNAITQKQPFQFSPDSSFPRDKLPERVPVVLNKDSRQFAINIIAPQLQNVKFDRKLHQTEGDEVFGTIKAEITGYILDFVDEHYTEWVYIEDPPNPPPGEPKSICVPTGVPTGKIDTANNYKRIQYWCGNYKDTYWGNWIYTGPPKPPGPGGTDGPGCFNTLAIIIGIILFALFLYALGPKGILALIIFGAFLLVLAFFSEIIKWIFRIVLALMLIGLIIAFISSITGKRTPPTPPIIYDSTEVKKDTLVNNDSIIFQHRVWKDYDNRIYEGNYWIKVRDYTSSRNNKNNIWAGYNQYDKLLQTLYDYDVDKLTGVYHLLDSIKVKNNQSQVQFAETVVCFVQDIPYTLVLENSCDAQQYNDPFTRSYLLNNMGDCDPYEKFGINTPVEFMANLKGDCDSRTLLLYTILSHFNYDVAILSSEHYSHSILGINLPISGDAFTENGKQYVLWETTSAGIRPGILPREVSNLNYWRISLQSKP